MQEGEGKGDRNQNYFINGLEIGQLLGVNREDYMVLYGLDLINLVFFF